jgi:nicotinate-nucleotide--dimethylbenzimidazole phosphoribosyltransferase
MTWKQVISFEPDCKAIEAAKQRIEALAIPPGSLGRLHEIAIKLAGIAATPTPKVNFCRTLVFSADHGVARHNVSAFPASITDINTRLIAQGRATISVLADLLDAKLHVIDVGIDADKYAPEVVRCFAHQFSSCKIRRGTRDMTLESAMTVKEMERAITVGFDLVTDDRDAQILVIGEMGIANTTASSAIVSALLQIPASEVTGPGTGLDRMAVEHKARIVEQAVKRCNIEAPARAALDVLRHVGGLEQAAMVGALIGAAERRIPVILDGFIVCASYLVASKIVSGLDALCFAGTRSPEIGFKHLESHLNLKPILDLNMRLGEGSAALLAYPIIRAAVGHLSSGATLDELGM